MDKFQHLKINLDAIQSATDKFSTDSCVGCGGFGKVYKGELVHNRGKNMVAFKRLDRAFGQGDTEFLKEIMTLSLYRHENIVSLLGYCDDLGEKILVYEYLSNKSLDSYLASIDLKWVQRLKICIGAARGLAYLHDPADKTGVTLLHRDIKSSNILLDDNWNAKISDFGLSKLAPANMLTYLVSNPAGTPWYIDPLYQDTGFLTKESDVYSFGVVLFEVLCGRLCFENTGYPPLVVLVREYYEQNNINKIVYRNIKDEIKESSLTLFVDIAYQCLSKNRKDRPLMTQILSTLEEALDIQEADNEEGILFVKVLRATKDRSENLVNGSDSYVVLAIDNNGRSSKAKWNRKSTLYVKDVHRQLLHITVYIGVSENTYRPWGKATMRLKDLTPEITLTCDLDVKDNHRRMGDVTVKVLYKPTKDVKHLISPIQRAPVGTPKNGGLLVVIIHGAEFPNDLLAITSSVSVLFRGQIRNTQMMYDKHPLWLEEFTFMLEEPPTDEKLHIELINHDSWRGLISKKWRCYGWVDIRLSVVVNKKWTDKTYNLKAGKIVKDQVRRADLLRVELHWRTSE